MVQVNLIWPGSPESRNRAALAQIYLDGEQVAGVFGASEGGGWVVRQVTDEQGRIRLETSPTGQLQIAKEMRRGEVRIVFPPGSLT